MRNNRFSERLTKLHYEGSEANETDNSHVYKDTGHINYKETLSN